MTFGESRDSKRRPSKNKFKILRLQKPV